MKSRSINNNQLVPLLGRTKNYFDNFTSSQTEEIIEKTEKITAVICHTTTTYTYMLRHFVFYEKNPNLENH